MFHVEMRSGMTVVREFNLGNERLWLEFIAPLMADQDFSVEGHDFTPRNTRLKVYEGPQLRPDQLAMGRAWQNVERTASDVTERVLAQARRHMEQAAERPEQAAHGPEADERPDESRDEPAPVAAELVRERLLGRIAAGAISAEEILAITRELMPQASDSQQREAARHGAWALLERGAAQLVPSGR